MRKLKLCVGILLLAPVAGAVHAQQVVCKDIPFTIPSLEDPHSNCTDVSWLKDGAVIPGANSLSYQSPAVGLGTFYFTRTVACSGCTATSNVWTVSGVEWHKDPMTTIQGSCFDTLSVHTDSATYNGALVYVSIELAPVGTHWLCIGCGYGQGSTVTDGQLKYNARYGFSCPPKWEARTNTSSLGYNNPYFYVTGKCSSTCSQVCFFDGTTTVACRCCSGGNGPGGYHALWDANPIPGVCVLERANND